MNDSSSVFSKLNGSYGLPTAAFAVASFVSFSFAIKDGFHFANKSLMAAVSFAFIAFGLYIWHQRDQSSANYTGEEESFSDRFRRVPLWSLLKVLFCFLVAAIFAFVAWEGRLPVKAQDKGEAISVHAKEVHRSQDGTENENTFHIAAVVESKTVTYSIKCDYFYGREKESYTSRCFTLSAGKDYSVLKFSDSINFWPPEGRGQAYLLIMYDIVSEKEK